MRLLRSLLATVRGLTRRNTIANEIREEMRFHVDMRSEEYLRSGLAPSEARRAAVRRFGNPMVMQDRGYDVRGGGLMETILRDATFACRMLRKHPAFSAVAVLTLALAIGVSTALFSVIDAALIRPVPYPHPEELVTISVSEPRPTQVSRLAPSMNDIRLWRTSTAVFSHIGMGRVAGFSPLIVETNNASQRLTVGSASEDFLEAYGVSPVIGRGFSTDDTREGQPKAALLGYAFWQKEFGGDPGVLGRQIRIQNEATTIVGVLPVGFYDRTVVWEANQWPAAMVDRRGSGTPVIGRLKPGVTAAQAAKLLTDVTPAGSMLARDPVPVRVELDSLYHDETAEYTSTVQTLSYAVGLIVLIACINVSGLLLARGATRHTELAIRASIGAGRGRLVRQMLTESVILAGAGALLGLVLAWLFLDSLVALIPFSLPANSPAQLNVTVLTLSLGLTMVTAVLFGVVPALKLSRVGRNINTILAAGGRSGSAPLSKRGGQMLIAAEVALALVLLAGSGLVLRSFSKLLAVDLGFTTDDVVTVEVEPVAQNSEVRRQYYAALTEAYRALPEVAAVGMLDQLSLGGGHSYSFPQADTGTRIQGPLRTISPGFFEALGVRAIAGRLPEESDVAAADAAIVDVASNDKFFAGGAVGHTLKMPTMAGKTPRFLRIVGVVPNLRLSGPEYRVQPEAYFLPDWSTETLDQGAFSMVVRLRPGVSFSGERFRKVADGVGPKVVIGKIQSLSDIQGERVSTQRNRTLLLSLLGGFGFLLTLVGIFSVTAYAVTRRTREIGVRVAFGATRTHIIGTILGDAVWPVAIGVLVGLAAAYYGTTVLTKFLFETTARDPVTLAAVASVLGIAAVLAAWLPARRAATLNPVTALRAE
ncbi:MAG: ADOP family duplicated permease [Vicinamibacterales bacterium]